MQRSFSHLAFLAVAMGLLVGPLTGNAHAVGEDNVVFDGAGWGHGVGMSQYGAWGMATQGSTYQQITNHYYQGTSVITVNNPAPIWVNLERNFTTLTLTVGNVGTTTGAPVAITSAVGSMSAVSGAVVSIGSSPPSGCVVTVTNPGQTATQLTDPACSFDFSWYGWATPGANPTTKVSISGCLLTDWNVSPSVSRPCQYARGTLHLRSGEDPILKTWALDLSAEMLLDDYVLGTSEMPYAWSAEALKAQAVASRSYGYAQMLARGAPATNSCDGWCHVKDTTSDQRYVGWGHLNTAPWASAVQTTPNQIITHPTAPNGVVTAFFSSSSGGATENVEERFGGVPRAYLVSVDDSVAIDGTVPNPKAVWQESVPVSEIAAATGLDYVASVRVSATRSGSGSAAMLEFTGVADGVFVVIEQTGTWTRTAFGLFSEYLTVDYEGNPLEADEMFFYRDDGLFAFEDVNPDGSLGVSILGGTGYTAGWDSITAVDLDGDGQDEMFFYRNDGLFRYYNVNPDGSLGAPLAAGSGYTTGWDAITAVDLDGDGHDEMFFYRNDGLFRYYNVGSDGSLPSPMLAGSGYTSGWDAITAVDLDGDSQDEMFFYRNDGLFRYYNVSPAGSVGSPMLAGSGYTSDWDAITAVDTDGDDQDEMFFYRSDGLYRYYNVTGVGILGTPIKAGSDYSVGWDAITAIQLDELVN